MSPKTQAILSLATFLLPRTSPITTLTHPTDLIALVVHATSVSLSFRLDPPSSVEQTTSADEETGEDDDDAATAVADDPPEPEQRGFSALGVSTDVAARSRLPEGWNARGEDSYTFTYRHGQSQMAFTIKVGRMGGRVCVSGMAEVCCVCSSHARY
jgi:proteasome inhibitor subunit 1 (PI31)